MSSIEGYWNGSVVEGIFVTWTTSNATIDNHVKYIDSNYTSTDESLWYDAIAKSNATRSHHEAILTNVTKNVECAYKPYSTIASTGEAVNGTIGFFTAFPDADGDGLHDAEEDYGWMVVIDKTLDGNAPSIGTHYPAGENGNIRSSRNNMDSEGDGLNDAMEKALFTNPQSNDTDGDGLNDTSEVNIYGTKPTVIDTDKDGIADGKEIKYCKTNATNDDTDGDNIKDGMDMNPLGNLVIAVEIMEWRQIDPVDPLSTGDFYVKVSVDGTSQQSRTSAVLLQSLPYMVCRDWKHTCIFSNSTGIS